MLSELDGGLFTADGPEVTFLGLFPYPTRMAVAQLGDGGLFVWSPIRLDDALERQVRALGPVRHLVAPNKLHHLFLAQWQAAFPDARLHGAPGLGRRRRDLAFDGELGDDADPAWAGVLDQVVFRGSLFMDEVVFHHRPSRTAIFCDLIQRFEPGSIGGMREALMRLDGLIGANGGTPREWRASFVRRAVARRARDRVLAWDPRHLVVAHGACAHRDARAVIERALAWLG